MPNQPESTGFAVLNGINNTNPLHTQAPNSLNNNNSGINSPSPSSSSSTEKMRKLGSYFEKIYYLSFVILVTFWGLFVFPFTAFTAGVLGFVSAIMFPGNNCSCCQDRDNDASVSPGSCPEDRNLSSLLRITHCCCCRKTKVRHLIGFVNAALAFHFLTAVIYVPIGSTMLSQATEDCRHYWDYYYYDDYNWRYDSYDHWDEHDEEDKDYWEKVDQDWDKDNEDWDKDKEDWDKDKEDWGKDEERDKDNRRTDPYYHLEFGGDWFRNQEFQGPDIKKTDYIGAGCYNDIGHREMKESTLGGAKYNERLKVSREATSTPRKKKRQISSLQVNTKKPPKPPSWFTCTSITLMITTCLM